MEFICDVHIPFRLTNYLNKKGHVAIHVNSILQGSKTKDIEIAKYADFHSQIVISKDEDFENLHFATNAPWKLIRILLGNSSNSELIQVFEKHLIEIEKLKKLRSLLH